MSLIYELYHRHAVEHRVQTVASSRLCFGRINTEQLTDYSMAVAST
jgi:hypothetical protein